MPLRKSICLIKCGSVNFPGGAAAAVICARYILIYSLIKKVAPADRPAALFVPSSWADGILINFINISYVHLSEGAYQENINFKLRS